MGHPVLFLIPTADIICSYLPSHKFQGVWPLLIESALILLQTAPTHIATVDDLKARLLQNIDGVLALHEFHVWQVTAFH